MMHAGHSKLLLSDALSNPAMSARLRDRRGVKLGLSKRHHRRAARTKLKQKRSKP
jgi:hypothetical protein